MAHNGHSNHAGILTMKAMINKIIERLSATWLRLLCVRAFKRFLALWRKPEPYKPSRFEELPWGVSPNIYRAMDKIAIPSSRPSLAFGFQMILSEEYPVTMKDGTVVHGCMIGSDGKPVFLIDSKSSAPQSDSKKESHST